MLHIRLDEFLEVLSDEAVEPFQHLHVVSPSLGDVSLHLSDEISKKKVHLRHSATSESQSTKILKSIRSLNL